MFDFFSQRDIKLDKLRHLMLICLMGFGFVLMSNISLVFEWLINCMTVCILISYKMFVFLLSYFIFSSFNVIWSIFIQDVYKIFPMFI